MKKVLRNGAGRDACARLATGILCTGLLACRAPQAAHAPQLAQARVQGEVPAQGMPTSEVKRDLLEQRDLPELPGWEARLYLIEFPPGMEAKLHEHPVPCVGYVLEGSFESAFGDEAATIKRAGDSFVDLPDAPHRFRNPDSLHRLRFVLAGTFRHDAPLFRVLNP